MSFDARSRERLEALGRQLPRPLPAPPPPTASPTGSPTGSAGDPAAGGRAVDRRHPVETEQDPDKLFRELMKVSADGSVPPHLLERLRQLEAPARTTAPPGLTADPSRDARRPAAPGRRRTPSAPAGDAEQELYIAFQQRLLEEGDESVHPY
ncbi:MAG: hypothetical protein QUV07_02400 [Cyanobium sp. CZS 25K]|nr:hypothetical protein [Cyanobium sp. CZS25K]